MNPADSQRTFAALAVISLALCVMIHHQVQRLAPLHPHNAMAFLAPHYQQYHLGFPVLKTDLGVMDLRKSWTPRILSIGLGYFFTRDALADGGVDLERFAHKAGLYVGFWLGLVFLLYLVNLKERALLPILGTYCGVAFAYLPGVVDRVMPWDMPGLFFYTLFVCLLLRRRLAPLLFILPVAVLFKETTALLALAFLFAPWPWRRRLLFFGGAVLAAGGARLAALVATDTLGPLAPSGAILAANLRYIFTGSFPYPKWYNIPLRRIDHPLLINGGLWLAFLIAPLRGEHAACLRTIFAVFSVAMLCWGIVFEYRIWLELLPICLYPFYAATSLRPGPQAG